MPAFSELEMRILSELQEAGQEDVFCAYGHGYETRGGGPRG